MLTDATRVNPAVNAAPQALVDPAPLVGAVKQAGMLTRPAHALSDPAALAAVVKQAGTLRRRPRVPSSTPPRLSGR